MEAGPWVMVETICYKFILENQPGDDGLGEGWKAWKIFDDL